MLFKKLAVFMIACVLIVAFGLIQGCSENEMVLEPTELSEAEILVAEEAAFREALVNGEFRFSVDESGNLIPYDGVNVPPGEEDLYAAFLRLSEIPGCEGTVSSPKIASALPGNWRYACWREICYALSRTKYLQGQYGQSRRDYTWNGGRWLAGDWNYDGLGYGRGGQCKHFASRIVARATGNQYSLPGGYYYANGDIGWCRPGDIIQRSPDYGLQHTAIVFCILARDQNGRVTKVDVIDANFVNYPHEMIARHCLPYGSYRLDQFRVW